MHYLFRSTRAYAARTRGNEAIDGVSQRRTLVTLARARSAAAIAFDPSLVAKRSRVRAWCGREKDLTVFASSSARTSAGPATYSRARVVFTAACLNAKVSTEGCHAAAT